MLYMRPKSSGVDLFRIRGRMQCNMSDESHQLRNLQHVREMHSAAILSNDGPHNFLPS
jgi:hypothetical protein